ncbi:DUF3182 family protein [Paenalcaligenes hominis]|uniref:DUF3182 family protein n=1 Tax=Paenalcaligenes hominis TaxID=643674 RepID=UPI003525C668
MALTPPSNRSVLPYQGLALPSPADAITQQKLAQQLVHIFQHATKQAAPTSPTKPYLLPLDTLLSTEAENLGVESIHDLYGGVVPYDFVKTKVLSHPLFHSSYSAPAGWHYGLGQTLLPYTLKGYSAFSVQDAFWTARGLIHDGPIRIKFAHAKASHDQFVCSHYQEVTDLLLQNRFEALLEQGVVIEEQLTDTTTYSVGQAEVAGMLISYIGEQSQTQNHEQLPTYGGTHLLAVQGGYEELSKVVNTPILVEAIALGQNYERCIQAAFPDFYASRRNYDVIHGTAWDGSDRLRVLEQSWRMGGASMAELLAISAFLDTPSLPSVQAWTQERYTRKPEQQLETHDIYCIAEDTNGYLIKSGGLIK